MNSSLHICSLNCQGLGQKEKRQRVFQWTQHQKCNILFVQETHFIRENIDMIKKEYTGECYHCFGNSKSRGVSIFIKKEITHSLIDKFEDSEGRIILINIEIDDNILTLVNLYAPNIEKERNIFFKKVIDIIDKYSLGILIVGGDMNQSLTELDRKSYNMKKCKTVKGLRDMIKKFKLIDIWRVLNPKEQQYTWRRKSDKQIASRIDYFLISSDLGPRVLKADIRPAIITHTDHQAISLLINHSSINKGKGYFKLNNSILEDENYKILIINLIRKYKENIKTKDLAILWDLFKIEVRDVTVEFCKTKAKFKKNEIESLEVKLKQLYKIHDGSKGVNKDLNDTNHISKQIEEIEEKLGKLYQDKINGAKIRARVKWFEDGEKNTKYFLGLEKSRQTRKNITILKDENGSLIRDQDKILEIEKEYYEKLYTSRNPDLEHIQQYINDTKIDNKLSEIDNQTLEGEFTLEECTQSVFNMKLNKAPGIDGLSVEFYRTFWTHLKDFVVKVFNNCYYKKELTNSQKLGLITLLYKKNDPYNLDNYRPITLLNVDTKIIAYTLANRLKPVLHKIIQQ